MAPDPILGPKRFPQCRRIATYKQPDRIGGFYFCAVHAASIRKNIPPGTPSRRIIRKL